MSAGFVMLSLGKWRYFLAGLALAVLIGLVLRAVSRITAPLFAWRVFSGTCREIRHTDGKTALLVDFSDANKLRYSAAFSTAHPAAAQIAVGSDVRISMKTGVFAAGGFPQTLADAAQAGTDIRLRTEQASLTRRAVLHTLLMQILICGAAAAVFAGVMAVCFPRG